MARPVVYDPIDAETASQLGRALTRDHPMTAYGMARACVDVQPGFAVTSFAVRAVRNDGCDVSVTACRGDLCTMGRGVYTFRPPLSSADDLPRRIVQIRNEVFTPDPRWLVTDPSALAILVTCGALAYGSLFLGTDGMAEAIAAAPWLEGGIASVFGSAETFGRCVGGALAFAVVVHVIEASIVVHRCRTSLHLDAGPTMLWGLLVFAVGYPIYSRFRELTEPPVASHNTKSK